MWQFVRQEADILNLGVQMHPESNGVNIENLNPTAKVKWVIF
jgi:hypothetical protein